MNVLIQRAVLGSVATNCYLIVNKETNQALIVDPADMALQIQQMVQKSGACPVAILLTHGHFDHIMAAETIARTYSIPIYAHEAEESILASTSLNLSCMHYNELTLKADVLVKDLQVLELAGLTIQVIHTPGHTKGGACYYFPQIKKLISGDTLFESSIGRTDFPTGSMSQLVRSVREKLFLLDEDVVVLPGHGPETTIGYEKVHNPYVC